MKYLLSIGLLILLFLTGCTSHNLRTDKEQQKKLYDSLEVRCYNRVMQTDSLRLEAENFKQHTQPGTPEYFRAHQFYINSYFNEKKFDQVLKMLDEAEHMPGYKELPGTQADYLYTRSRCYQFTQQYDKVITISRQIMDLVPAPGDTLAHESIRTRAVGAMNNVNNIFYFTSRPAEGAAWFHQLRSNSPKLLKECCQRDMMIFEGYLTGLAGQQEHAKAIMDSALSLPIYRKTAENTFRDCAFAASAYFKHPERKNEVERLMKLAISEGRKDKYISGINWGMNLLAQKYINENRFQEAIQLQYQGLEIGVWRKDSAACSNAYFQLSKIYYKWGMYPQAEHYIDKALFWNRNSHATTDDAGLYFLHKFQIEQKKQIHNRKQHLNLLEKADSCFSLVENNKQKASIYLFRAIEWITLQPYDAAKGLEQLELYLAKDNPNLSKDYALTLRALGFIRLGREEEASKTLLEVVEYHSNEYEILDTLMNHYIQRNDNQLIAHLSKLREPILKVYQEEKAHKAVISADIRYQTQQKEQENRLLAAAVEIKNSRLQLSVALGLFLLAISLCVGGWFWMRQRSLKLHLHLQEQEKRFADQKLHEQSERLKQLIASRQKLNNHNEDLLRQLAEVQVAHEKTCNLDRVMESLQPRLLTNEEEEQFRIAFSSLHPTILLKLRSICPRATRTDELLCMLIILKQTNEEISRTLGISRASVLQNRYRLRSKLTLEEGSDLDTEVRRLLMNR